MKLLLQAVLVAAACAPAFAQVFPPGNTPVAFGSAAADPEGQTPEIEFLTSMLIEGESNTLRLLGTRNQNQYAVVLLSPAPLLGPAPYEPAGFFVSTFGFSIYMRLDAISVFQVDLTSQGGERSSATFSLDRARAGHYLVQLLVVTGSPAQPLSSSRGWFVPVAEPGGSFAGWTRFVPSADSRIVYVSSSQGNDANSGLSESAPKATIAAGYALIRSGFPDWLLLRRGDSWTLTSTMQWTRSGRSASEPALLGSYGSSPDRPLLRIGNRDGVVVTPGFQASVTLQHVAVIGLEFYAYEHDPSSPQYIANSTPGTGLRILGVQTTADVARDVLFEDNRLSFFGIAIAAEGSTGHQVFDLTVRRNLALDSFSGPTFSQGFFFNQINGLLIEENLIDHNGLNEQAGAPASVFNHGIYVQTTNQNVTVRRNMITRNSDGCMLRSGGVFEDNLVVRNPIGLSLGYLFGGSTPVAGGVSATVRNNVILEANDIDSANPRGEGMLLGNISATLGGRVEGNIIAHDVSEQPYGFGIELNGSTNVVEGGANVGAHSLTVRDNTVYAYHVPFRVSGSALSGNNVSNNTFQATHAGSPVIRHFSALPANSFTYSGNTYYSANSSAQWFDVASTNYSYSGWTNLTHDSGSQTGLVSFVGPDRSLGTYNDLVGGVGTAEDFYASARLQSRANWNSDYTATSVNAYIRAGFARK
jgi:parallel beta helix pectate lyase-like protein